MKTMRLCPGRPAVWCAVQPGTLDVRALVETLRVSTSPLMWLESARAHPSTGRYSLLAWDPWLTASATGALMRVSTHDSLRLLTGNPLDRMQEILARYSGPLPAASLPPVGLGWYTCLSYELNRWIERIPAPRTELGPVPELVLYGMRQVVVIDHARARTWLLSVVDPHQPARLATRQAGARLEALQALLPSLQPGESPHMAAPAAEPVQIEPMLSQAQFEGMVGRAQEAIQAGEIFQVNLAQRVEASWDGSAWPVYQALRAINPSPFACFVQEQAWALVSCSPERLVRVRRGVADTRPIAGTRPRGARPEEDVVNSLELLLSEKERAEHIMLVDLARNDLGRVCRAGSVRVDELMALEDYSHVIHIVSNVRGRMRPGTGVAEIIRAMFPGGTITGCPKVRAMELIRELEPVARGPYTGSMGWIGFDGSLDLNILIRTMVVASGRVSFHVGAGIVADSIPEHEYRETLAKGRALCEALQRASAGAGVQAHALRV